MQIVIIKGSVIHDKVKRETGEILTVSDKCGKAMVKRGLAKEIDEEPEKKGQDESGKAGNDGQNEDGNGGNAGQDEGGEAVITNPPDPPKDLGQLNYDELAQELSVRGIRLEKNMKRDKMIKLLKEELDK